MVRPLAVSLMMLLAVAAGSAQQPGAKPGINDPFKNPDVKEFQGKFEGESREVYAKRARIVAACGLKPGMVVADVGAGTGLFTRLFAREVGPTGQVLAADISPRFLEHVQATCRAAGLRNVTPVLCSPDSADLPPDSADLVFVCDTYHHFEFPRRTLASIHRALRPGGRLVVVDFVRVPGKSSDWVLGHVRAGQEVVEREIAEAGFRKTGELTGELSENYLVTFAKTAAAPPAKPAPVAPASPVVAGYGAVVPLPAAAEPPAKGSKVVFDVTGAGPVADAPLPGLVRAATLLNLGGATGLSPADFQLVVVLHGEATAAALSDAAYREVTGQPHPHADLMHKLGAAGVRFQVCGQSLARKGYDPARVRPGVAVAASAVSAVVNLQARGFAYVPAP